MSLEHLDNLADIKRVETPEHLFAQIQQKIEHAQKESFSQGTATLLLAACALLVGANLFVVIDFVNTTAQASPPTDWMLLNPPNYLY